jgi:hypothetical protein
MAYWVGGLRVFLGLLLVVSGAAKMPDVNGLHAVLFDLGLRGRVARVVACTLPYTEIATGLGVLVVNRVAEPMWMAAVLFAVFTSYQVRRARDPLAGSCYCFGALLDLPPGWLALSADLVPLVVCIVLLFQPHLRLVSGSLPLQGVGLGVAFLGVYMTLMSTLDGWTHRARSLR